MDLETPDEHFQGWKFSLAFLCDTNDNLSVTASRSTDRKKQRFPSAFCFGAVFCFAEFSEGLCLMSAKDMYSWSRTIYSILQLLLGRDVLMLRSKEIRFKKIKCFPNWLQTCCLMTLIISTDSQCGIIYSNIKSLSTEK